MNSITINRLKCIIVILLIYWDTLGYISENRNYSNVVYYDSVTLQVH
jgi:hypothetical protein